MKRYLAICSRSTNKLIENTHNNNSRGVRMSHVKIVYSRVRIGYTRIERESIVVNDG
jgi:hypothetical protein